MSAKRTWLILLLISTTQWHCIESYVSPYHSPATGYLIVEGYISGNSPTYFRLTRSIPLPGDSTIPAVTGATLQLEGSDNSTYPFTETGQGYYMLPPQALSTAARYRLRITLGSNESYLSDFVPYRPTPPIDSVNWTSSANGVNIYVNTHDPANNTRYYQWKYDETWEYTSESESGYMYQGDTLAYRPPQDQEYFCWRSDSSSAVLIGNSSKLAEDVIYRQPMTFIPANTWQLGVEYSIIVSQYSLTDSAYLYLSEIQKNTEQLGSIFDAQPTQLFGNIHSLSNPGEQVIGFISAGTVQQQRIFIYRYQLPNWTYSFSCPIRDTLFADAPAFLSYFFGRGDFVPIALSNGVVTANVEACVDCRAQGGTTLEPAFWQ